MKPMDLSKFRKDITKSLSTISTGFSDPSFWIDTGSYTLNYAISGSFKKGMPLDGKFNLLVGPSGTGKSLLSVGYMGKYCQDQGVQIILLDTENAVDKNWAENFGLDISEETGILRISVSTLDDIAAIMSQFTTEYKKNYGSLSYEEKPKVLFIIDSLGMATTAVEQAQFNDGEMKGDMGRKPKQLFSLCRNFIASCGNEPIGCLATNHTYSSQSVFKPEDVIAGGGAMEYAPSIIVALQKKKLKENEDGEKTTDVQGISVSSVVRKTRYTKPFQQIEFTVPWDTGVNKYSGLFELFSNGIKVNGEPLLKKEGNQYSYTSLLTGEYIFKKFRKNITNEDYDMIMYEVEETVGKGKSSPITFESGLVEDSVDASVEETLKELSKKAKKKE